MLVETADDEILEIDAAALVTHQGVFDHRFFPPGWTKLEFVYVSY
jgi:hypothetical protein